MNKNTKMRSIAGHISVEWNFRNILNFFIIDLLFVIFRVIAWCYITEADYYKRSYFDGSFHDITGSFSYGNAENINQIIDTIVYNIPGSTETIYAGGMIFETIIVLTAVLFFEMIMIISGLINGGRRIRKRLSPLDVLAEKTKLISSESFDGSKFHDLENALEKINADNAESFVSTGNAELQDIEDSINSMILRMRNSYIQQARFVSDASHELRTPISVIQGYANMLERWGKEDEKVLDEGITAIISESENMRKLIEQLLFLARGDNGRNKLTIEKIDLSSMMKEIYEEYRMVDEKHLYSLKNKDNTPVYAYGDYAMIKQTARILIDNSVKYTPENEEIILSADFSEDEIPTFTVQDTGIGMKSEDLPKIFGRFYRVDDARNRKTGGTGLGLSIAMWIVNTHKGYFNVSSYLDAGTKFTVFLPEKLDITEESSTVAE